MRVLDGRVGTTVEDRDGIEPSSGWPGRRTTTQYLQRRSAEPPSSSPDDLHAVAAEGTAGSAAALPHLDEIQRSFGRHDVGEVRAHVGGAAEAATQALGAEAYATGRDVAFRGAPSLHTAAHEAAHVVQQRAGVTPAGGVGSDGDEHERHADEVADRVVRGESAEELLDQATGAGAGAAVQAKRSPGASLGQALAVQFRRHGGATPALQLRRANGVSVSGMRFTPRELPADGATTAQGSVQYGGRIQGGAKINWSLVGDAHGSSIDANGLITPGNSITAGKDSVKLNVKAVDSHEAGAFTEGHVTLWDTKFLQAKKDYPTFVASTYAAAAKVGKFDVVYNPRAHTLKAEMKLEFKWIDDNPWDPADKWNKRNKAQYQRNFIQQAQSTWSGHFTFSNKREPQSIWGKLGPVRQSLKITPVETGGHFKVEAHRHPKGKVHATDPDQWSSRAAVHGNTTLKVMQGHDKRWKDFRSAEIVTGEQARLTRNLPGPIPFAADSAALAAHAKLDFFATYLKRIHEPKVAVAVQGHAGAADTGTARAKQSLSQRRAQAVATHLHQLGVHHPHTVSATGKGDAAGRLEADLTATVDPHFRNDRYTIPHEVGHLLGLDDEYPGAVGAAKTPSSHTALVAEAFGQDYADEESQAADQASANVMFYGKDVRAHDYVTFWAALGEATGAAALPVPPFTRADWKING